MNQILTSKRETLKRRVVARGKQLLAAGHPQHGLLKAIAEDLGYAPQTIRQYFNLTLLLSEIETSSNQNQ
jgi:methylphosphotriester-DNA--protein-cysteine methyltransferase